MTARLTPEFIRQCRTTRIERPDLEFKLRPSEKKDKKDKEDLGRHVCGFANTEGGNIIFGLGDKLDPNTSQRPVQGITQDDPRIDATLRSIRDGVKPKVDLDCYDVSAEDVNSVVVITVQKPADNRLRFFEYVAYKRVSGPETIPMTEDEINAFYIVRMEEWAEQCARQTQTLVESALGELALRIHRTGGTEIEEDTLYPIIKDLATPEMEPGLNLVLKTHPVLQFRGTRVSFIAPQALTFYAATRLKAKEIEGVPQYMDDERWDDVLLGVAGLADSQQLDYLVEQAIVRYRPLLAIECLLSRRSGLPVLVRTRSRVLDLLKRTFRSQPPDYCMQVLYFRELGGRILFDSDTTLRLEALRIIASGALPSRVLRSLYRRLVPDAEEDPMIRAQIAEILAEANIDQRYGPRLVAALIDALDKHNNYPSDERDLASVRDAILVALGKHLSKPPNEEEAQVIRVAICRARDDYKPKDEENIEGNPVELPPRLDEAIQHLGALLDHEGGVPA